MAPPATLRAGDSAAWIESSTSDSLGNAVTSAAYTATVFLRANTAGAALTVVGTARADGGWDFSIDAADTADLAAGQWFWQTVATAGDTTITLGTGSLKVLASLAYTGDNPAAFDGRSDAEKELALVQNAIRVLVARGAKSYQIGDRQFTSNNLGELMQREAQLKAVVAREQRAQKIAAGLGDPTALYVRFT